VLQLARQNHTGVPGSSSHQPEAVLSLRMIDATNGWALTVNPVLRTTDGGSHWTNVTPPHTSFSKGSGAEFFTASLAWVATQQADATTVHILADDGWWAELAASSGSNSLRQTDDLH